MDELAAAARPTMGSLGESNLRCPVCGQMFYSEAAPAMSGRACPTKACTGRLEPLDEDSLRAGE